MQEKRQSFSFNGFNSAAVPERNTVKLKICFDISRGGYAVFNFGNIPDIQIILKAVIYKSLCKSVLKYKFYIS